MEDWQQRVIDEQAELRGRIEKLNAFLSDADKIKALSGPVHMAMQTQLNYMIGYSYALNLRIELFNKT